MRYVVTNVYNGANLRASPSESGQLKENMRFGTLLDLVEDTGTKWKKVRVFRPGPATVGFVSDVNLTAARTDAVARLIASAAHYWDLFERGQGREDTEPFRSHVLTMWRDLAQGSPPGDNTSHPDWPWSAAGMCAFVRRAGGYSGFVFNKKHSFYVHDSIRKRNAGAPAPFWGYRISEKKPEVGDLIAQWRVVRRDYDFAAANNNFSSHTDVICQVLGDSVRAIGANVPSDTVGVKVYRLDSNGFLAGGRNEIVLMKNMANG